MLALEQRRPKRAQRTWQALCVSILLAITGLAMVDHWVLWLAQRNLVNGIKTVENNQYIVFHILAATQAGLLTLLGAGGLSIKYEWGRPLAFISKSMTLLPFAVYLWHRHGCKALEGRTWFAGQA